MTCDLDIRDDGIAASMYTDVDKSFLAKHFFAPAQDDDDLSLYPDPVRCEMLPPSGVSAVSQIPSAHIYNSSHKATCKTERGRDRERDPLFF